MKISYNTLKRYIPNIKSPEDVAKDLIMHAAEVEEIIYEGKSFDNMVIGEVKEINSHPDADKLKICMVDIGGENTQIVCGGTNLELGQKVAVAKIGASVSWHGEETITMKKTKIRGVESSGMICASEEIGLKDQFPAESSTEILDLGNLNSKPGTNIADALEKNEITLEVDNKAINHRPDLFSHIGIIREIYAINSSSFDFEYENKDFSNLKDLGIKNEIPEIVKRYIGLQISNVKNIETPDYIKEVLEASSCESKGLLIDLSNYSLYMYGQPTHIFDADKISGNITIRFAKTGEKFIALDDKEYDLSENDIVIADSEKILALGGIIGGKSSAVSDETKNIIIEGANFDQAILRMSGKKLGIRTDALNVFEKDILPSTAIYGVSLIVSELEKEFSNLKLEAYSDCYEKKQENIEIDYDLKFINKLIGKEYNDSEAKLIIKNLGIKLNDNKLLIPTWRKDLNYKADIAEEIARIDGYDNIEAKVPEIQLGAVIQDNIYKVKKESRNFFSNLGFFDMYTYSFVNESLMKKCNSNLENAVALKNYLSEDATHMKPSLIPNLLLSVEKNYRDFKDLKLFEIEKIFSLKENNIIENYNLSGLITSNDEIVYYNIQNTLKEFFKNIGINKYFFDKTDKFPAYSHKNRVSKIMIRGQEVGFVGEIKPRVTKNFGLNFKIGFFELNLDKIKDMIHEVTKTKEISNFQASSFDINFLINKTTNGKDIKLAIEKTNPDLIQKVELFDIYENEEKLAGKRSLSFKIYIQKLASEISDIEKNDLIKDIVSRVEKKGGTLR